MLRLRASAGAFAVVSLLGLAPVAGQAPQPSVPVLRASVDQVVVDVVVTDEHGGVVPGLTAADFEIFEKGKPQAIGAFSEVFLPLVRPTGAVVMPPVATDVRTNQRRPEGRIYVLVLDDFHVGLGRTADVRKAAKDFLGRQVQAGDLVAVVTTTGVGGAFQDFTEDAALAARAVDRFVGRKPGENAALQQAAESASTTRAAASNNNTQQLAAAQGSGADISVTAAVAASAEAAFGARNADPMSVRRESTAIIADGAVGESDDAGNETNERARGSLRTLRSIADGQAGVTGRRKAVLYFGEGLPMTPRAKDLVNEL
jgi:VWFA-related protein